jgi:hypothetical protein
MLSTRTAGVFEGMVNPRKRALVVGIDAYAGAELRGCVDDAVRVRDMLATNEDQTPNFECVLLTSQTAEITRAVLRHHLLELFRNCRGEDLLFYFAGHGAHTPWGPELVTQDYGPDSLGVSMDDVVLLANRSRAREAVLVLDCCSAGDLGDALLLPARGDENIPWAESLLAEGVTVIAASRSGEVAREQGSRGVFTRYLLQGLDGAAAGLLGEVTSQSLFLFASRPFGAWEQRPVFKSHVSDPATLRTTRPQVDVPVLRALPDLFVGSPDARVTLDPEYEGEGRPLAPGDLGTPKQLAMDRFRALRNAGLVDVVGAEDLYWAATRGGSVYLTPLGQYFWNLADQRRL